MTLRVYGSLKVLSAAIHQPGQPLVKDAYRHTFNYTPRPGYLYVRSRAISSRTNDNFDTFPAEEIKKAWRTFIGKPVFVNHHNEDHRRMRGVIIDAALHEDTNPDGSPDTWVEVLHEVDAIKFPRLARAILKGWSDRTSMGTDVRYSVCSVCNNRAETPLDYCVHIPRMKGMRVERRTASGAKERVLVHETCYGLGFFENSHLVEEPADPTAYAWVDSHGLDQTALSSLASKVSITLSPAAVNWFKTAVEGPTTDGEALALTGHDDVTEVREDLGLDPLVAFWTTAKGDSTNVSKSTTEDPSRYDGVGLMKDDDGYFVKTHRARSDSYESPEKIPAKDIAFIESTGSKTAAVPVHCATCDTDYFIDSDAERHDHSKTSKFECGQAKPGEPSVFCSESMGHEGPHMRYVFGRGLLDWGWPEVDRSIPSDPYSWEDTQPKSLHAASRDWLSLVAKDEHRVGPWREFKPSDDSAVASQPAMMERDYYSPLMAYDDGYTDGSQGLKMMSPNYETSDLADLYLDGYQDGAAGMPRAMAGRSKITAVRKNAFGEVVAPAEVNTLRPDVCPVCGENDTFDGQTCEICGYVLPPDQFADPDLDQARETDLRQDVAQGEDAEDALGMDPSLETDEGLPLLTCDTCGTEHQGALPGDDTVDGAEPGVGDADSTAPAPAPDNAAKPDPGEAADQHAIPSKAKPESHDQTKPGEQPKPEDKKIPGEKPDDKAKEPRDPAGKPTEHKDADPAAPKDRDDPKSDPKNDPKIEDKGDVPLDDSNKGGLKAGDTCPACGKGTLVPKDDAQAVDETGEKSKLNADTKATDDAPPVKSAPDPTKKQKASVIRAGSTSRRDRVEMRPILEVVKRQQALIEKQAQNINALQKQVTAIAKMAGMDQHLASLVVRADVDNPAQPVAAAPEEAPVTTTEEARAPETTDSVDKPGETPGANNEVAADAVTTVDSTGVVEPPTQATSVDVTAPVSGTDDLGPKEDAGNKVYPQITTPNPAANTEVAFPWTLTDGNTAEASKGQERFVAALRLAKLRNVVEGKQDDEIATAQAISANASISDQALAQEIAAMERVHASLSRGTQREARRDLVPQAAQVARVVPNMTQRTTTAGKVEDDSDLFF